MNVVDPLTRAPLSGVPPSTVRDTLPMGVPAVELTVTVTRPLAGKVTVGALMDVVLAARFTVNVVLASVAVVLSASPL